MHNIKSKKKDSKDYYGTARFLHKQRWSQIAPKQDVWLQLEEI